MIVLLKKEDKEAYLYELKTLITHFKRVASSSKKYKTLKYANALIDIRLLTEINNIIERLNCEEDFQ